MNMELLQNDGIFKEDSDIVCADGRRFCDRSYLPLCF